MIRTGSRVAARPGFTLVELMVAAAVCVIIMAVLATAFQTGIDTMRQMRSAGDMASQERAVGAVLKRDLQARHFLTVEGPKDVVMNQGWRLADYRFDTTATSASVRGGFFSIVSPPGTYEGRDADGFISTRADGTNRHVLLFTSILPGGTADNLYTATVPAVGGTQYTSTAAEIAYFLGPQSGAANGSTPLYTLMRRQRLVAANAVDIATLNGAKADTDVISTSANGATVNTLADFARGTASRLSPTPILTAARYGDDILLTNVISFEVKPTWSGSPSPGPYTGGNTDFPYDTFPSAATTFDTAANPKIRVTGLQVRVRVYDPSTKQARQATYVFTP